MAPTNLLRADNKRPVGAPKRRVVPSGGRRDVIIRAGKTVIRARLRDTPTADRIWAQLPIYSTAETWGGTIHFETHVETGRETGARQSLKAGDIAYWVEDDRIIIGFAMTPLSKAGEIRMPSPVNIWAQALDDVAVLAAVMPGERVSVLHADS